MGRPNATLTACSFAEVFHEGNQLRVHEPSDGLARVHREFNLQPVYGYIRGNTSMQEFLLFLLPLINIRVLRRRTARALSQISSTRLMPLFGMSGLGIHESTGNSVRKATTGQGKYWALSEDQCPICAEDASASIINPHPNIFTPSLTVAASSSIAPTNDPPQFPIQTPYVSSCGHVYCYVCLSERVLRAADDGELGWECLRCEAIVLSADRVQGAAVNETPSNDFELNHVSLEGDGFPYGLDE